MNPFKTLATWFKGFRTFSYTVPTREWGIDYGRRREVLGALDSYGVRVTYRHLERMKSEKKRLGRPLTCEEMNRILT